jgi:hypothetical protein
MEDAGGTEIIFDCEFFRLYKGQHQEQITRR